MEYTIEQKLNASRKDLLDLGMRNSLLNFRIKKNKIDVIDEKSDVIYRILADEEKSMKFRAAPKELLDGDTELKGLFKDSNVDWAKIFTETDSKNGKNDKYVDSNLQTKLDSPTLHARLLSIYHGARTYIEEQGVNILYLALGFLEWYESDSSDISRKAPLILLPVELNRANAQERFTLTYNGDDIGFNLSLYEKMKTEFNLELPKFDNIDSFNIAEYFDKIEKLIKHLNKWRVISDEIVLSFFSFGKYIMYKDLDESIWPNSKKPKDNLIISSLLGDGFKNENSLIPDNANVDELVSPYDSNHIIDADSSQTHAILDVKKGQSMVIQGPPGTGKSQTITNIIAEAIGDNKKVLFIAEKMAALEVVKRRLDQVGLGDAVLELHSHKTNKQAFLEEIRRTIALGNPRILNSDSEINSLIECRDRLNNYANAINLPILKSNISPIAAIGYLIKLMKEKDDYPHLDFRNMQEWTNSDFKKNRLRVEELQNRLSVIGIPNKNPFWGTKLKVILPTEEPKIKYKMKEAISILSALEDSTHISQDLGLPLIKTINDCQRLIFTLEFLETSPDINSVNLISEHWTNNLDKIHALIRIGKRFSKIQNYLSEMIYDTCREEHVIPIRQNYMKYGKKWWKVFIPEFRDARKHLRNICKNDISTDSDIVISLIDSIIEFQTLNNEFEQCKELGLLLFGNKWKNEFSDWDALSKIITWTLSLYKDIHDKKIQKEIAIYLHNRTRASDYSLSRINLGCCTEQFLIILKELSELVRFDFSNIPGGNKFEEMTIVPINIIKSKIVSWIDNFDKLSAMVGYNIISDEFKELNLSFILPVSDDLANANEILLKCYDYNWYHGLLEHAFSERKELRQFERTSHEFVISKFRELDKHIYLSNRAKLASKHWHNVPNYEQGSGQLAILKREINKKRNHIPIRQLMVSAGDAIKAIKPVFMMGPLSVATYLPPGSIEFDLIIFDEASQVKPVDGFGAILRGKQVVVIGDSKQLPPTSFFESISGDNEFDDTEEVSYTSDLESILGMFVAQNAPERMLKWHYRSKHESLIAVSNHEFYDNKLMIFPSSGATSEAKGLVFNHVPDTYYDRGGSRTNQEEAKAVAQKVIEHAKNYPHLTLGVAAFSTAQRDAIQFQIELFRKLDPGLEHFFNSHSHEPFFVKNLENVQGDERDVIMISIGYGRSKEGAYLGMNFGPLNKDGGERRLNVLISRARRTCEVFANFTAEDMDLTRTSSKGVIALHRFLNYARTKNLIVNSIGSDLPESPFEEEVISALREHNYLAESQIGVAGFRIDIGIKDKNKPNRYLLGIECDGASYHSSLSARDRDRLRQEVLENLGWKIHRIWSTDWFRNSQGELKRVIEQIERAKVFWSGIDNGEHTINNSSNPSFVPTKIIRENNNDAKKTEIMIVPYKPCKLKVSLGRLELHEVSIELMVDMIKTIACNEGPLHKDILVDRITKGAGVCRAGNRIQEKIESAIDAAKRKGLIVIQKEFISSSNNKIIIRDRSEAELQLKRYDMIPPSELQLTFEEIVKNSFSIAKDELIDQGFKALGILRTTSNHYSLGETIVKRCLKENIFEIDINGKLKSIK